MLVYRPKMWHFSRTIGLSFRWAAEPALLEVINMEDASWIAFHRGVPSPNPIPKRGGRSADSVR